MAAVGYGAVNHRASGRLINDAESAVEVARAEHGAVLHVAHAAPATGDGSDGNGGPGEVGEPVLAVMKEQGEQGAGGKGEVKLVVAVEQVRRAEGDGERAEGSAEGHHQIVTCEAGGGGLAERQFAVEEHTGGKQKGGKDGDD